VKLAHRLGTSAVSVLFGVPEYPGGPANGAFTADSENVYIVAGATWTGDVFLLAHA
jgi:hypothetical protein